MPGRPDTHAGRGGAPASWHPSCLRWEGGSPTQPKDAAAQGLIAQGRGSRPRPISGRRARRQPMGRTEDRHGRPAPRGAREPAPLGASGGWARPSLGASPRLRNPQSTWFPRLLRKKQAQWGDSILQPGGRTAGILTQIWLHNQLFRRKKGTGVPCPVPRGEREQGIGWGWRRRRGGLGSSRLRCSRCRRW